MREGDYEQVTEGKDDHAGLGLLPEAEIAKCNRKSFI
jgi:hypothetical protein